MNRICCLTLLVLTSFATLGFTQEVEQVDLQRRQQAQQRARAMTQELIAGILDIQIRQLEENQLTKLPVYEDIKIMRTNVDELVDNEMASIVQLLVEAQSGDKEQRLAKFNNAREEIREVVLALMAERQRLYKRLQIARLAAQARELIALQQKAETATAGLSDQPMKQRETLALAIIQDQRDVNGLFLQLVDTLNDVGKWGGRVGAGAVDGLRILKAAEVGTHLDNSLSTISTGQFDDASNHQKSAIKGLKKLLEKLEETRGLIAADREAARKLVQEITKKQEELRETTKKTDLTELTPEALTEKQEEIHQELGKLAEQLQAQEQLQPLLEQSKAAAHEAIADLFEGNKEEALDDQNEVIGALAELEHQLDSDSLEQTTDQSADTLADRIEALEKAQEELQKIAEKQDAAEEALADNPAEAKKATEETAAKLEELTHQEELPSPVTSRLANAQEIAEEAAAETTTSQEQEAMQSAAEALEDVSEAIEKAEAELEAQIADAKREQLAVEVGELARAAEALERAAVAQQEIADTVAEAAQNEGLSEEETQQLIDTESAVESIAEDIAKGVENTSPETNELLSETKKPIDEAKNALEDSKGKPKEDSAPQLAKAEEQANKAAQQLKDAAAQLREDAGKAAAKLAELANEQLNEVQQAKSAVEDAIEKNDSSLQEDIAKLQEAKKNLENAKAQQQKAAGNEEAAAAQQLANDIAKLQEEQAQANQEAEALKQGKANSPINAAAQQQKVADESEALANNAPEEISQALDQAKQAAAEAAKQTIDGDPNKAEQARQEVKKALDQAKQAAEALANQKVDEATGQPNAEAQQQVSDAVEKAQQLASDASPQAEQALATAKENSDAANNEIAEGNNDQAKENQQAAMDALNEAQNQVEQALADATEKAADQLAQQAEEFGKLAEQSAQVDPNATAALRQAEKAAEAGGELPAASDMANQQTNNQPENSGDNNTEEAAGQPMEASSEQVQQAANEANKSLQQAAAALTAREQQIARDKAVAEALTDLALEQQQARNEIDEATNQLEQVVANEAAKKPAYDMANHPPTGNEAPMGNEPTESQPMTNPGEQPAPTGEGTPADPAQNSGTPEMAALPAPSPELLSAAQKLNEATQKFADAQQAIGEGAVEISGQEEVANAPIREGLETASDLPLPGETMLADLPEGEAATGEPTEGATPAEGAQPTGETPMGTPGAPMGSQLAQGEGTPAGTQAAPTGEAQAGQSAAPASAESGELGTGFVPESPLATAQAIAGNEAVQQAQQAMAAQAAAQQAATAGQPDANQGSPMSTEAAPSSAQAQATAQQPMQGTASALADAGGTSDSGSESENQLGTDSALELLPEKKGGDSQGNPSDEDSDAKQRQFDKTPWFAKLPPDLQKAIQASARRPAPRGYEERLRRYFENVD